MSVLAYGGVVGFVQGSMDPENHSHTWSIMENFQKEVALTSALGGVIGALTAVLLCYIRGFEIQRKGPMIKQVLKPDSLNFDDTEDRLSVGRMSENDNRECRFSNYDEEEERVSLINITQAKRETE